MTCADAIPDSRSQDRVLDRERLKRDPTNLRRRAFLDQPATVDLAMFQRPPCLFRRKHWTRRAFSQSPGVVRMRVCEHDRVRMQPLKFSKPIKAAIDHHPGAAIRHEQRSVHAMPPGSRVDFTARAEEPEFHLKDESNGISVNADLFEKMSLAKSEPKHSVTDSIRRSATLES